MPIPMTRPTAPIPFDPSTGFVGECAADGQCTRVASIALDHEKVVLLSLVGYETSIAAAFGRLLQAQRIGFLPDPDAVRALAPDWTTTALLRDNDLSYWMWHTALRGTKEKQGLVLPHSLSLTWGQQHPPAIPATPTPDAEPDEAEAEADAGPPPAAEPEPVFAPRYLVASLDERVPPYHRFFAHLRGLRVVLPPTVAWVEYLWARSLEAELLTPLPALGVRGWRLHGDPRCWNALSTEGIRSGALTATPPTDDDKRALGLLV